MICCILALLALLPGFAAVKASPRGHACHARRSMRLAGMAVVLSAGLFGAAAIAHAGAPGEDEPAVLAPICGLLGHAHDAVFSTIRR